MRLVWFSVTAVVIGTAIGTGIAMWEMAQADLPFAVVGETIDVDPSELGVGGPLGRRPRIEIEGSEDFDFGVMEKNASKSHVFVVKNVGDAPLQFIGEPKTTCSCAVGRVEKKVIPPGDRGEITLTWSSKDFADQYRQSATFQTNDPARSALTFVIFGRVVQTVRAFPGDIVFSRISAGENKQAEIFVLTYRDEPFGLNDYDLVEADTADFFEVQSEPMTADQIERYPEAKHGIRVTVSIKPGLPLGQIGQTVRLMTSLADVDPLNVPIRGRVVSDVSLIGGGGGVVFNAEHNLLRVGSVPSAKGATFNMHVLVKGPERENVELSVGTLFPDGVLAAKIGPVQSLNRGAVLMYPLTVEITPGSRPALHLGSRQGKLGKIVIETTHPNARQVPLYIEFAVE